MIEEINLEKMEELLAEGAQLIDVRETEELDADGYIEGMIHMPLSEIEDFEDDLPRDKPIIFYCRSGRRSLKAAETAETWTDKPVYSLEGGILAYKAANGE